MFYLKGRGKEARYEESWHEDDFGWWLSEEEVASPLSGRSKDRRSSGSSSSMLSCVDSDEPEAYALAREFGQESRSSCEKIELTPLNADEIDVELIEKDANALRDATPHIASRTMDAFPKLEPKPHKCQAICYTPERLVRCQEYRILTPSPRYLAVPEVKITRESDNPQKARQCRRRLNYLIDSKQVGADQLKALFNLDAPEVLVLAGRQSDVPEKSLDEDTGKDSLSQTEQSGDTSGIQSNDWSSSDQPTELHDDPRKNQRNDSGNDSRNDRRTTPLRLCDELAMASTGYRLDFSQERYSAVNEVVSILEALETEPDRAAVLLDDDRFCNSTSSHDQLTRLALAIETDANVPGVLEDPENLVRHLQRKVEKLQVASKDIYRDICNLRKSFQCDEERMAHISLGATKLREDVHEMRYLDDLLNLLRGELERISRRNWPFVLGHTERHSEEVNLIV